MSANRRGPEEFYWGEGRYTSTIRNPGRRELKEQ
jgi:hypothetical protein